MASRYCRIYIILAAVFIIASMFGSMNMLFVLYSCMLCGMIPMNILAYDEKSGWNLYSCAFPYTDEQIVSSKYILGLSVQTAMVVLLTAVQIIKVRVSGEFDVRTVLVTMLFVFFISTMVSSLSLPFMFRWGVEKGRIAYYVMIGMVCAGFTLSRYVKAEQIVRMSRLTIVCAFCAAIYALSWYMSVYLYGKREIE